MKEKIFIPFLLLSGCSVETGIVHSSPSQAVRPVSDSHVFKHEKWDDVRICGAAVATYFFIAYGPQHIKSDYETHYYESNLGAYKCMLTGKGRTHISWENKHGKPMHSLKTRFRFSDDKLLVSSDMNNNVYVLTNLGWAQEK